MTPFEWVENLRKGRSMTISRFCYACGLRSTLYYNWKNGRSNPSKATLKCIADCFGITVPPEVFVQAFSNKKSYHWEFVGTTKVHCHRKECEWAPLGVCTLPSCMRQAVRRPSVTE